MIRIVSKPRAIEEARVIAGYSQRGLIRLAGINAATLNQTERKARQVLPQTAKAISDALGLNMSELFEIIKEARG